MRARRTLVVVAALLMVGVVGGVAYASIPGPGGVINGCRKTSTGDLRVIDSAASCPSGYAALNWNQTGPAGPAGADGVLGYEVVRTTLDVSANSYGAGQGFSLFAPCPTGKVVLGGGGEGPNHSRLQGSRPSGDPTASWLTTHRIETTATSFPAFTLETYAICATVN